MAGACPAVTLPTVVEELLSEMAAAVRESARIPDEHLLSLKLIFGSSAIQALDLVDRQSVTLISSPSGRRVYQAALRITPGSTHRNKQNRMEYVWDTYGIPDSNHHPSACKVLGSSGKTYTCLASCHYCSCPAFAFSVLRKSDSLLCKHLLAVYLSQVVRTCQELSVSDKQLTDIMMEKKQDS